MDAVRAAMHAIEYGVLPAPGGMWDQAWRFPLVVDFVAAEFSRAKVHAQEEAMRAAERNSKRR